MTPICFEIATWHTGAPNEILIVSGQQEPVLYLIQYGRTEVFQDGQIVDWYGPGTVMGELRFITGKPAVADVVFSTEARYVAWDTAALQKLLKRNARLKTAFEALISANIASKLGDKGSLVKESISFDSNPHQG